MRKHKDPYLVHDPKNVFEVAENSSHPELYDRRRVYKYKGKAFNTATEAQKYLENIGVDWYNDLKLVPVRHLDGDGSCIIVCNLAERVPNGQKDIRELEQYIQRSKAKFGYA